MKHQWFLPGILLLALASAQAAPKLKVGDPAPPLRSAKWFKRQPVEWFDTNNVYVVEFWATWCPPCRASIPHLSSLQQKYGDKVVVIGISSEAIDKVKTFIADPKLKMEYVVGVAKTAKMNELYMKAFKQRGIPCAFIVGKDGKIAYVGHPMGMDKDLEKIVRK